MPEATTVLGARRASLLGVDASAWLLAALSGVLQVLIFPTPNLTFLCWIAFAPLLVALMRARPTATRALLPASAPQAFGLVYISGLIYSFGTCYWIYHVMNSYGGLSAPVAALVLVMFCLAWSVTIAIFGLLVGLAVGPARMGPRAVVLAPVFWVTTEIIRRYLSGFPWDPLGTVLVDNIPLTRIATVTGVYGLSFEILLINCGFAVAFLVPRRRRALMLATAVAAAALLQAGVLFQPPPIPADGTARLVQPDLQILDPNVWTQQYLQKTLNDLSALSIPTPGQIQPGEPAPDLIVWPEAPAPFYINEPTFRNAVSRVAQQTHTYMIVGALALDRPGDPNTALLNSAALVSPQGQFVARYDKIHLVPFGEFVPFQSIFGFASKLTREVGDFIPGTTPLVMELPNEKLGVFICYESVFPDEIRQFVANGAQLLVNISNDGWFGHTAAPFQHLNQARMRAIENNRWLLRDTNTGITSVIDPFGRVVQAIRRDHQNSLDAMYGVVTGTTFYTRHGDWFPWACAIISLLAIALGMTFLRTASRSH
ncbi:MAG TPA: apolipoprotein N-acyltransferase [Terriglobales bacterium]|nr:apolipoprotein N-acyltransferase [Terriglobales bacterium]